MGLWISEKASYKKKPCSAGFLERKPAELLLFAKGSAHYTFSTQIE
jgi:hypothetical protein